MQNYSYSVAVRIWHPSMNPEDITQELGGANAGLYTRHALDKGAKLVVAIEMAPESLACLRRKPGGYIRRRSRWRQETCFARPRTKAGHRAADCERVMAVPAIRGVIEHSRRHGEGVSCDIESKSLERCGQRAQRSQGKNGVYAAHRRLSFSRSRAKEQICRAH
jgi:hypothetical protein